MNLNYHCRFLGPLLAVGFWCGVACAQENAGEVAAPELTDAERAAEAAAANEVRFAEALLDAGLSVYADMIIDDGLKAYPKSAAQFKAVRTGVMLRQGKLQEVLSQINALPNPDSADAWAQRLTVAAYFYSAQKYADADKLYKAFFDKFKKPAPDMIVMYRDAAYYYVQLLLLAKRDMEALNTYKLLLGVPMSKDDLRVMMSETASLAVRLAEGTKDEKTKKELLTYAEGLVDKLLWGSDLQFGNAVVLKANIAMQRGDVAKAQSMVEEYKGTLEELHNGLKEADPDGKKGWLRASPMSSCRYLLGVMLMNEAQKEIDKGAAANDDRIKDLYLGDRVQGAKTRNGSGAFNHFFNVFIRYPQSQFAVEAGKKSEEIRQIIKERYGVELKTQVTPEQLAIVRQQQFAGASVLFSENNYQQAAELYERVLTTFPDAPESVPALANLAMCYIEMSTNDDKYEILADTVAGHLAERFSADPKLSRLAGELVRQIAQRYDSIKKPEKSNETLELFVKFYPDHPSAASIAIIAADRMVENQQFEPAVAAYQAIANQYKGQPFGDAALSKIVGVYESLNDFTNQLKALDVYAGVLNARKDDNRKPGRDMAIVLFKKAELLRNQSSNLSKEAYNEADAAKKTELMTESLKLSVEAIRGYNDLAKELEKPNNAYESSAEDRTKNEELREASLFLAALSYAQLQPPKAEQIPALRQRAIDGFQNFIKQFPKSEFAPKALLQIGTLYTSLKDVEKSKLALDQLQKNYPDSPEAKNSIPRLASALIEMGLRGEGVAEYRRMLEPGGKFTDAQYLAAGQAMAGAREYELALQAFDKALAATQKGSAVSMQVSLEQAKCHLKLKRPDQAHKVLDAFLKDNSKTTLALDANELLLDVISAEIENEMDDAKRNEYMKQATDVFRWLKQYRKTNDDFAELDLRAGNLMKGKMLAERKLKKDQAADISCGKAITAYQTLIMRFQAVPSPRIGAVLQEAYHEALPLMMGEKKWEGVVEDGEAYLRLFPAGKYVTDIRNWVAQAKIEVGTPAAPAAQPSN